MRISSHLVGKCSYLTLAFRCLIPRPLVSISNGRFSLVSWNPSHPFSTSESSGEDYDPVDASTPAASSGSSVIQPIRPKLKLPPTSTSTFSEILDAQIPFVDKTGLIGDLFENNYRVFLARPRKWGKSTLLSTMKMILQGGEENREKLKNLDIVKNASRFPFLDWKERPVVFLDFSKYGEAGTKAPFDKHLVEKLHYAAEDYDIPLLSLLRRDDDPELALTVLFLEFQKRGYKRASFLVDEYDAPIVNVISQDDMKKGVVPSEADWNRRILRDFFTALKAENARTFRCFVTGLNKFSMTGLFSGADDFMDISFDPFFSGIAGYTWKEMETAFQPLLNQLAETYNLKDTVELRNRLEQEYGGYSWFDRGTEETRLFNPWDVNNCLSKQMIVPYWTKNSLSSRLLQLLDSNAMQQLEWMGEEYSLSHMESFVELPLFIPQYRAISVQMLMLNGYLTVKSGRFGRRDWMMKFDFPNDLIAEYVCKQLTRLLFQVQSDKEMDDLLLRPLQGCLQRGDILSLFSTLRVLFTRTPYHLSRQFHERHIHAMLFQMFSVAWGPSRVRAEVAGQVSRADLIVDTKSSTHIIELKVIPTPNERQKKGQKGNSVDEEQMEVVSTQKSLLTTSNTVTTPPLMSPQLKDAILQLQSRQYETLVQKPNFQVQRYAVVYYANLELMDAVEIDKDANVIRSVWDEDVKVEPIVTFASSDNETSTKATPSAKDM